MFFVPSVGFASGYVAQPAHFDGIADYLTRGATLTGAADSKLWTVSYWFKTYLDTTAVPQRIFNGATAVNGATLRARFYKSVTNGAEFYAENAGGTAILQIHTGANSVLAAGGWYHVLMSIDLTSTATRHLYLNDVSALTATTYTNDTIDFTQLEWGIGGKPDGSDKFTGEIADLWVKPGLYIDFSVAANRRKFIDSSGKPVFLGLTGEKPTGSAPLVFMSQTSSAESWITNKGTGGGFTTHGTITRAQTSPSNGYIPPTYTAEPVFFDGTNDYLTRGAGLTGAADAKQFTLSCWVNPLAAGTVRHYLSTATSVAGAAVNRFTVDASNRAEFQITAPASTLDVRSTAGSVPVGSWTHILASINLNDTTKRHIYINDVADLTTITNYANVAIDFTQADWAVGASPNAGSKYSGDIADLWFQDGQYIDFSVTANRRKFINADGTPAELGEYGEIPIGVQPLVYLHGDTSTWNTNDGTGGGFTIHGDLTSSLTSPSPGYDTTEAVSVYDLGVSLASHPDSGGPQEGGALFINSQPLGGFDYTIKDGPVTLTATAKGRNIRTLGTNIGDMTTVGGLAAAFNGATSEATTECAVKSSSSDSYVGKTYSSRIWSAICYGSNNDGYINNANPTVTLTLYGKQGAAPANSTNGTVLGSTSFTDQTNESGGREITSSDTTTVWDHVWVRVLQATGTASIRVAEIEFFDVGVDATAWFTNTADSRSAIVVIKGDLTIPSGIIFTPPVRKMFTAVYVTGNCAINGELSMTARGANHGVTGSNITAANILIANGVFSGVTNPQVPAAGGAGALLQAKSAGTGTYVGNSAPAAPTGGTGGGGGGGLLDFDSSGGTTVTSGAGAAGTSFGGGPGSGGASMGGSGTVTAGGGTPLGGIGGDGAQNSGGKDGGGAGNPGGANTSVDSFPGANGTGGVLALIVEGTLSGTGAITANGAAGGDAFDCGGGGSGGGSVTVIYGGDTSSITPVAAGGAGGNAFGVGYNSDGATGGAGTARKLQTVFSLANGSMYDLMKDMANNTGLGAGTVTAATANLTINAQNLAKFDYVVKDGNQTVSTFINSDWFSANSDHGAVIVVKGDLTINSGQTFTPAQRKLYTAMYVTGNCTINGTLSMSSRGGNHGSTGGQGAVTAAAIRIANGTYSSVTNPQIPAAGGVGAEGARVTPGSGGGFLDGANGISGATGGTGGGGSGAAHSGDNTSGAYGGNGAIGSCFSGGPGGGAAAVDGTFNSAQGGAGTAAGGKGGNADQTSSAYNPGGGAGNPGGNAAGAANDGANGTGGVLMLIVGGTLKGSGNVSANGAVGGDGTGGAGSGGGGSGGGAITILRTADSSSFNYFGAGGGAGGAGATGAGGDGGTGIARKLTLV